MVPRLLVHSTRRKPPRNAAHICQSVDRLLSVRPVARRRPDLHSLGPLSRIAAHLGAIRSRSSALAASGDACHRGHLRPGHYRLGVLPCTDLVSGRSLSLGDVPARAGGHCLSTYRNLPYARRPRLSGASLAYSSLLLAANSFNPFIYFRF